MRSRAVARPRSAKRSRPARSRLPPIRRPGGWTALAAGCAIALAVLALAGAPRIGTVTVAGTRHLTADAVRATVALSGQPIFSASTADARAALRGLPAVRDARVTFALPDTASVTVVEREAVGRWSIGTVEWYVDDEGVLFASADPRGAPTLHAIDDRDTTRACAGRSGGRCIDPAVVAGALRLARIAPGELRADATKPEVHIDAIQGLVVRSGAGWEVRFGTPDQLEQKLSNAKKVLSDNPTRRLDYVDVRSPDRIVFSPQ